MSSSATCLQMIVPWEMALPDELEDKLGDSIAVKMAKFDKRQCCQHLALQRELEAEEQRKAEEAERVHREQEAEARKREEEQKIHWLEAERKRLKEERRQAQQAGSSSQQPPASTGKAIDRPGRCSTCMKAGKECKLGTGRSKSCVQCQKLKAKCDLIAWTTDMEKRPVMATSPHGGEKQKCHRKLKASMEVVVDVDNGDDKTMEDTLEVESEIRMVVKLLQKNNTTIETLAKDIWDLSGVLEESFEPLKAVMTTLVNHAQNEEGV
ncbi:hypothetical protein PISMIDRAFT_17528 [Pisolithus microcarpus 441]|uniref:Uncharacterized protein n=1 Tax=Pisolithus microcarpus 441 TaxID=765257 RepID=A0A0C9XNY1_9AGAM|nr:hypothetical protein PISMIDRAFT_17528 [Pisolithus microcarpus 441]